MTTSDTNRKQPAIEEVWRRIKRAGDRCEESLRLMTVTTVDDAGRPDARLMILRGASSSMKRLWFYSMRDAVKVAQIRRHPWVCAVAYDPSEIVQLTVRGRAEICANEAVVDDHWAHFEAAARNLTEQPARTGRMCSVADPWMTSVIASFQGGSQRMSRESFALIELYAQSIEWTCIDGPTIHREVFILTPGT